MASTHGEQPISLGICVHLCPLWFNLPGLVRRLLVTQDGFLLMEYVDVRTEVPDTFFDRQWAFAILERAFTQLAAG